MKIRPYYMRLSTYFGIWTVLAVLFGMQSVMMLRFENSKFPPLRLFGQNVVAFYVWAILAIGIWWLATKFPLEKGTVRRDLLIHLPMSLLTGVLQTILFLLIIPRLGVGPLSHHPFQYWLMFSIYSDTFTNLFIYWSCVGVYKGLTFYQRFRDRELRNSQLETQLAQANLQMLKSQLDPHFLFNTMNSISSLMRKDPESADLMLEGLANLLRMSLVKGNKPESTLRDEMEFLEAYLDIQQTRYGEKLQVNKMIAPDVLDAMVPTMILQPLAENSILHGIAPRPAGGHLEIRAFKVQGKLRLVISDDGMGLPSNGALKERGVGLNNTRSRLQVLYGKEHEFSLLDRPEGGVEASVTIPFHASEQYLEVPA